MKKKYLIWLRRTLVCFTLLCIGMSVYDFLEHSSGADDYESASQIALSQKKPPMESAVQTLPSTEAREPTEAEVRLKWIPEPQEEDEYMTALKEIDLQALQEVNPDVVGWIMIPDTKIDYPILQGGDNEFYLKHTWEKNENSIGSIFMEHRNKPDFTEFNTIIYGHNMNNGSMFGDLDKFRYKNFQKSHPYVYLVNAAGIFRYEVFSLYQARTDSPIYGLSFNQRQTRETFLESALKETILDTGVEPALTDRILTLSTCTVSGGKSRWAVLARLPMILVEE